LDAAASGAAAALMIVLGIVSNIIAFLAIMFFLNALTEWTFELLGLKNITLLFLLAQVFVPIVFLMGVPWQDCQEIGMVVAEKSLINEFIAYKHLGQLVSEHKVGVSGYRLRITIRRVTNKMLTVTERFDCYICALRICQPRITGHPHCCPECNGTRTTFRYHAGGRSSIFCWQFRQLHIGFACR